MTSSDGAGAEAPLRLRGHHLLCVFGFRGLGYDQSFVENMHGVVDRFFRADDSAVELVEGRDDICAACPHLGEDGCTQSGGEERMAGRDAEVLGRLGLAVGQMRPSTVLAERVLAGVTGDDLPALCGECRWLASGYCAEGLRLHRQAP